MRIALKAVSNTATPQAISGKATGASFLDILSVGTGVDIFGVLAVGSDSQTGSDSGSDATPNQDAKSLASAFQAELSAGNSAANSTIENAPAQDQSETQQTSSEPNSPPLNANLSTAPAENPGSSLPPANAVQLLFAAQAVSHPTGKAGKQQIQQGAVQPVDTSIASTIDATANLANAALPAIPAHPVSVSAGKAVDSQTVSGPTQIDATSISGVSQTRTIQTGTNHDREQSVEASQAAPSKTQQDTNPQIIANAAQILQNSFAAVLPAAAQSDPPPTESVTTGAVTSDNGASSTQSANQGPKVATNPTTASTFLSAAMFSSGIDLTQPAGNANQFKSTTATTFNVNPNLSGATTGTSHAKNSSQDSTGSSTRNAQSGSDALQHSQTDARQTITVAARPTDNGTAQAITFGPIAASHQTTTSAAVSSSGNDAPHRTADPTSPLSEQSNAAGSGATSGINSARVIQSMNESEMRVGMHSSEFGDISIRTMVSQQQMQTQISVDHNELSSALSAHIPAMQAKLGNEYGLHASIEVSQNGASFNSGERGQSSQRDQKAFVPSVQVDGATASADTDRMVFRTPLVSVGNDRLDIRA